MKKTFFLLAALLIGATSMAQSLIGTIDADYILNQMPEMVEVNKELEAYGQELQTDLQETIQQYEEKVAAYQSENENYTETQRQEKEQEIMALENEIQGFRQKAQVMMQMKRNEITNPLYDRINEAMLEVIQEGGYTQIFHAGSNALAFSTEGSDITIKVMELLGIEATQQN